MVLRHRWGGLPPVRQGRNRCASVLRPDLTATLVRMTPTSSGRGRAWHSGSVVGPTSAAGPSYEESQHRQAFKASPDGLAITDLEGRLLEVNPAFAALQGCSAEELAGRTLSACVHPDDRARASAVLAPSIDAAGAVRVRLVDRDGHVCPVELRTAPFSWGGAARIIATLREAPSEAASVELLQRRLAALATVAATLSIDQPQEARLRRLVETVVASSSATAAVAHVLDPDRPGLSVVAAHGMPAGYEDALLHYWAQRSPPAGPDLTAFRAAIEAGRRVFVPNARATLLADPDLADLHPSVRHATWEGILALPLRGAGTLQGSLDICFPLGRRPAEDEIEFLAAVAAQAAVGVENARLVRAERARAAGEERQRLARDLHDSVSQALFSMTLHARAAQLAMDRAKLPTDSPIGRAVGEVRSLAHGALAEMRALIFELRPGALAEEGLVAALTKQAAALTAREGLPIAVYGPQQRPALPADTEEQLYRIALEAVHNVLKHADAHHAEVRLATDDGLLLLTVTDDGRGFHVTDARPGHLGLGTMRQRAESVGARFEVASRPGEGTIVTVRLPCPSEERR